MEKYFNIYNTKFKFQDFDLFISLRSYNKLIKNNLYIVKYINEDKFHIYSFKNFNYKGFNFPLVSLNSKELDSNLVNLDCGFIFEKTQKIFYKNKKTINIFNFVDKEVFKNIIRKNLENKFNIYTNNCLFLDNIQYKIDDNYLEEQIVNLYYFILTNVFLIFKDIDSYILELFLDEFLNTLKEIQKICIKNKYFYPNIKICNRSTFLYKVQEYLNEFYNFLNSFQEKQKKEIVTSKNFRKQFFNNMKSKINIPNPKVSNIYNNEKDLLQILNYKINFFNEFKNKL